MIDSKYANSEKKARLSCDLSGKKAVVVGASRGLGARIATVLHEDGAELVIGARTIGDLRSVAEAMAVKGKARIEALEVDVANRASVKRFASKAVDILGGVDILVNVAGVQLRKPTIELTEDECRTVVDVNLLGTFWSCQEFGRIMIHQGKGGRIINIASLNSFIGLPERAPYCMSKAGVVALTKVLAIEWARYGIRVNAVSPGYFETEMTAPLFQRAHWKERLMLEIPVNRVGIPADLDGIIRLLASDNSDYITGQNFFVDGGFTAGEIL